MNFEKYEEVLRAQSPAQSADKTNAIKSWKNEGLRVLTPAFSTKASVTSNIFIARSIHQLFPLPAAVQSNILN